MKGREEGGEGEETEWERRQAPFMRDQIELHAEIGTKRIFFYYEGG